MEPTQVSRAIAGSPRRTRGRFWLAAAALIMAGAAAWFAWHGPTRPEPPGTGLAPDSSSAIELSASGAARIKVPARLTTEPARVTVSAPAAASGARIAHLEVRAGDTVAVGDLLVILDRRDAIVSKIAAAVSTADARAGELAAATARAQGRIEEARAAQARVEARARAPRQQLARMQRLRERRVVTAADLDRAVAANDQALRETREAASAVQVRVDGTDPEVEFAQLELDAALGALAQAESRINDALIHSRQAGRVAAVVANAGDALDGQALLELELDGPPSALLTLPPSRGEQVRVGDRVTLERPGSAVLGGSVTRLVPGSDAFTVEVGIDTPLPAAAQQLPAEGWTAEVETKPGA